MLTMSRKRSKVVSALICRYIILPISSPGGRVAIVVEAGRDAADAADAVYACKANPPSACERSTGRANERRFRGRRSRVVLTPRRRRQVRGGKVGQRFRLTKFLA